MSLKRSATGTAVRQALERSLRLLGLSFDDCLFKLIGARELHLDGRSSDLANAPSMKKSGSRFTSPAPVPSCQRFAPRSLQPLLRPPARAPSE